MMNIDYLNKINEISDKIIKMAELGKNTTALEQMLQQMMAAAMQQPEPGKEPEKEQKYYQVEEKDGMKFITVPKTLSNTFEKGDISLVTTKEMFYGDILYYEACMVPGETTRNQVKYLLEQKAKELGGTALAKMFNQSYVAKKREIKQKREEEEKRLAEAYKERKAAEAEEKRRAGNLTKFSDLPEGCKNLHIGEGWIANDEGIYMLEDNGKTVKKTEAAKFPFLVDCLYQPYDAGAAGPGKCGIRFKSIHGDWCRKIVEQATLMNAQQVLSLAKDGVIINSHRALPFTDYVTSMIEESVTRHEIPIHKMSSTLGWTSDYEEFLPFTDEKFVFEKEDDFPELMRNLTEPAGNYKDWLATYKEVRKTKVKMFNFATIALFASPIVGMLPDVQNGFICNIYGKTHVGKSICTAMAGTIWGRTGIDGYAISMNGTYTGIEVRMNAMKNIPLIIEDANNTNDPEEIPKFIMTASNGVGRIRATKNLGNRAVLKWNMVILSNSEATLTSYGHKGKQSGNGGIYTRTYETKAEKTFPKAWENDADRWKMFFASNYGHAGREFIEVLKTVGVEKIQKLKVKFMKEIREKAAAAGRSVEQAEGLAILMVADYLSEKYIFQDGITFTIDEMLQFTAEQEVVQPAVRFYNKLEDLMLVHSDKFEGTDPKRDEQIISDNSARTWQGEYWGLYTATDKGERWLCVDGHILDKWLTDYGVDRGLFFEYLRENNLISSDKGGTTRKTPSKIKDRPRLVNIKLPGFYDDEAPEEDKEENKKDLQQQIEYIDPDEIPFPPIEDVDPFQKAAEDVNNRKQNK